MRSDSVDAFYALARRERLIPLDALDALAADPTLPRAGLGALAAALGLRPGLSVLAERARAGARPPDPALADAVDAALDEPAGAFVPAEYAPEPAASAGELAVTATPAPRRAEPAAVHLRLWIGLGLGLWLAAVVMWLVYIYKPFAPTPPTPKPAKARAR